MPVSKGIVERFKNKEVGVTFNDGGELHFAKGVIASCDESGFILKYKSTEQYFSYDCVLRIREIFRSEESERNGRN